MQTNSTEPISRIENKLEGKATDFIERRTARLPSGTYLTVAIGSMVASAVLMASARRSVFGRVSGRAELANFIGQWAPSLLILGVYNKLVKIEHELLEKP